MYTIYEVKDMDKVKSELEEFLKKSKALGKSFMFWKGYLIVNNYNLLPITFNSEDYFILEQFLPKFIKLEESGIIKLYRVLSKISNIVKNYDRNAYLLTINLKKKKKDFFLPVIYSKLPYSCCNKNVYYVYYLRKPNKDGKITHITDYMYIGVNRDMEIKKIVSDYNIKRALSINLSSITWGVPDEDLNSSAEYFILLKDYLNNYRIKNLHDYLFNPPFNNVHPYISLNTLFLKTFLHLNPRLKTSTDKIVLLIKKGRKVQPVTHEITNIKVIEHKLREIDKPRLFNELVYATRPFTYRIIVSKLINYINKNKMKNIKYNDYWTYPHEELTKPLEELFKFTLLYTSYTSYYGLLNGNIHDYYNKLFDIASDFKILSLTGRGNEGKYYFPLITRFKLNNTGETYYIANLPDIYTLLVYLLEKHDIDMPLLGYNSKPYLVPIVSDNEVKLIDWRNECNTTSNDFINEAIELGNIKSYDEYYIYNVMTKKDEIIVSATARRVTESLEICDIAKYLPLPGLFIRMDDVLIGIGKLFNKNGEVGRGIFMFTKSKDKHLLTSVDREARALAVKVKSEKHKELPNMLINLF